MPHNRLIAAFEKNDLAAFRGALTDGASPDSLAGHVPILHAAALFGRPEFVKALIEFGADVNLRDASGETAVMLMAALGWSDGHVESLDALAAAGADLNAGDFKGSTAVDYAAFFINALMGKKLVALGARGSAFSIESLRRLGAGGEESRSR